MKVHGTIHNSWKLKSSKCSLMDIAKGTGRTWGTIQRAISTGICSPATLDLINDYFLSDEYKKIAKQH